MGYEPEDFEVINDLVRFYPEVNEFLVATRTVTTATGFPIESRDDLEAALARRQADGDESQRPSEASPLLARVVSDMPAFYFPIVSRKDLIAKLVEFGSRPSIGAETSQLQPGGPSVGVRPGEAGFGIRPEDLKEGPLGPTDSPPRPEPMSGQLERPLVVQR